MPDAPPRLLVAGRTDRGLVRDHNEDAFLVLPEQGFFLVADGLGGHEGGEVASAAVVAHVERALPAASDLSDPPALLRDILSGADDAVRERATRDLRGMGSTVVGLLLLGDRFWTVHAGDSRAYRLDAGGRLERLTADHTPETECGLEGGKPFRSGMITRAIGVGPRTEFDVASGETAAHDRYLLCSDGLTDTVPEPDLVRILADDDPPDETARRLIEAAKSGGGHDNITAVVIHLA